MSLREAGLRYGEFLLHHIRLWAARGQWEAVHDGCDRFERLMLNLPPVPHPLVWQGDYA